jgi:hypothetical protein
MRSTHYPAKGWKSPGVSIVAGTFSCDGSATPSIQLGAGWSTTGPSTGVYTVTFTDSYPALISCVVSLEDAAGGSANAILTDATVTTATGGTLTIETQSADGTAADLSTAGQRVATWSSGASPGARPPHLTTTTPP